LLEIDGQAWDSIEPISGAAFVSAQLESGTSQTLINEMNSLISTKQPVATGEETGKIQKKKKTKQVQKSSGERKTLLTL